MKNKILFLIFSFVLCLHTVYLYAEEFRSASFIIKDTTMSNGGEIGSSASFRLLSGLQNIIGSGSSTSFFDRLGYEYFPFVSTPVITATAGDTKVDLSWTASLSGLGFSVASYEIGKATSPGGSYIFTNVGNVNSYSVTGLTNNTTYFFVVRTIDNLGNSISTSSQVFATPVGATTGGGGTGGGGTGGGGGGGGGGYVPPSTGSGGAIFSGRAYPKSEVTLLKDAQVVAQTVSGADASFKITLTGLSSGNYTFSVYSEDKNGNKSATLNFPVGVVAGSETNVTGIFLSPTINTDKEQVRRGDNIGIFGISAPAAEITIEVNSESQHFEKTKTDANGVYFYNFDSSVLEYGDHNTRSKAATSSEISPTSRLALFKVGDTNIERNQTQKCPAKGDVNSDCKVNLVDFSIAAFWYGKTLSTSFADIEKLKLNGDGKINLIDFSIMAFYWTG